MDLFYTADILITGTLQTVAEPAEVDRTVHLQVFNDGPTPTVFLTFNPAGGDGFLVPGIGVVFTLPAGKGLYVAGDSGANERVQAIVTRR